MILLPIHIFELLTLSLILLSIFRVFKHLSLETSTNTFHQVQTEHATIQQKIAAATEKQEPIHSLVTKPLITKNTTNIKSAIAQQESKNKEVHTPEPAQALLKNYIGDFF